MKGVKNQLRKHLRQCHRWEVDDGPDRLEAYCPYCRKLVDDEHYCIEEGYIVVCPHCDRAFILGKQK